MKKHLVLTGALLCLSAACANAQIDMLWNDCLAGGGTVNETNPCTSNLGSHILVTTFIAPAGVTQFGGATSEILLASNTTGMPQWWHAEAPAGCRSGAVSSIDPAGTGGFCANPYAGGSNLGAADYQTPYLANPNRAKITADFARDSAVPLTAGTEYYANAVSITNSKSVGATVCAGCAEPICLVLDRIFVGDRVQGLIALTSPGNPQYATWQGGAINDGGGCPNATPAKKSSWGAVKSLYR